MRQLRLIVLILAAAHTSDARALLPDAAESMPSADARALLADAAESMPNADARALLTDAADPVIGADATMDGADATMDARVTMNGNADVVVDVAAALSAATADVEDTDSLAQVLSKVASAARRIADDHLHTLGHDTVSTRTDAGTVQTHHDHVTNNDNDDDKYPYWQFLPSHATSIIPDSPTPVTWTGRCYKHSTATAVTSTNDDSIHVTLTLNTPTSLTCSELYLFATLEQFHLHEYLTHGSKTLKWTIPSSASDAERWDVTNKGIRVFMFDQGYVGATAAISTTALLFEPLATKAVQQSFASRNVDFLEHYRGMPLPKRTVDQVTIPDNLIQSGDFIGVLRLDGLDPMLAWAMGGETGHVTTALRADNGTLFICESTDTTSYWVTPGVQCTPYSTWVEMARAASYQYVWLPLSAEARNTYNVTRAWEFVNSVVGLKYGYNTMLWSWVDTVQDNYPCIPHDSTRCLSWALIEILFAHAPKYVPMFKDFYDQAWNHRLNATGLPLADLLKLAHDKGIPPETIPTIPERDEWRYNTTRFGQPTMGRSMVCCVFVCNVWKSAGIFGSLSDDINCGEFTNWDDYSLQIFESNQTLPSQCVAADPNNPHCQMGGEYGLTLTEFNTRPPSAHMSESCPSLAPDYVRPMGC